MRRIFTILFICVLNLGVSANTPKISVQEYIDTWKDVAINQMLSHGIPASITLSQGILESGFGNSMLAVRANNHFGIKCHDWKGKTFVQDDDKKDECFRKYDNAAQSFEDHSEFISGRSRYASLFELETTDYKGWAKGLKEAGYATNPLYAQKLIELIERYELNRFDDLNQDYIAAKTPIISNNKQNEAVNSKEVVHQKYQVLLNKNKTKYVVAGKHDTFYQIAKEFKINLRQLNKWNDFPPTQEVLSEGDKVYLMPKRKKASRNLSSIIVKEDQNLWSISQEYGIQLKSILQKNNLDTPDIALNVGTTIRLR